MRNSLCALALGALLCLCGLALAGSPEETLGALRERWSEVKYGLPAEKERADQYHAFALQAREVAEANPYLAEPLVREGMALAAEAQARGGIRAYWLAQKARESLEESLKLDEGALHASAYTTLATLHARGLLWPFNVGKKNALRAEKYFRRALALDPQGIDPNFLYGEYLLGLYRLPEARGHLERALKAPLRPGEERADGARREEIQALLAKIEKDLKIIAGPAGRR
jgi:tetratricopeptide (TPR) repeat protein